MAKKIRPKHSENSNANIKFLAKEATAKILSPVPEIPTIPHIPDIPDLKEQPPGKITFHDDPPILKSPLFSNNFWDSVCALSFCGGFTSLGLALGLSLR